MAESSDRRSAVDQVTVKRTADSVMIAGTFHSMDVRDILSLLGKLLLQRTTKAAEDTDTVEISRKSAVENPQIVAARPDLPGDLDVLNWDDFIPAAPPRPGGRLLVRVNKAPATRPPLAEDPWAS